MTLKKIIRLSPLTQKRLDNFLRIRRARVSLILLTILFVISLMAELLCNSRPLLLRVNQRTFFPVIQSLTLQDLFGEDAAPNQIDYHQLLSLPEYKINPANRIIWPLIPYSPGDVINAADLHEYRTVRVSIVPEYHIGRLNLKPDLSVIRTVGCEPFFNTTTTQPDNLKLDAFWKIPPAMQTAINERLSGKPAPAITFTLENIANNSLRILATLVESTATDTPPPDIRVQLRQIEPPQLPFQLRFRQNPDGSLLPVTRRLWQQLPATQQQEITRMVTETFKGMAPSATIAWHNSRATVSCGLTEISWPFPPVKGHWMGIDSAGRDVAARVLYGMRTAMAFGLTLALWAMFFGLAIGAIQGFFGGWTDTLGQRLTEIWSALPFLYVMIFVGSALGRSFIILLACYALFNWIGISYYMRAEFLRLRSRTFVEAARCQGFSAPRIIFSHILPNALMPLVTLLPFSLIGAIGSLTALDFLGFGLPPLTPSWGELLQQAQLFRWAWWLILFPSLALFIVMLLTVLVGEGLRDAFDPRPHAKIE